MNEVATLTRNTLRELVADAIRTNLSKAPYEQADAILHILKTYAPKSFVEGTVDYGSDDKYVKVAEEMIRAQAFNIAQWEIHAYKPTFTDAEVQLVDDAIGAANITVTF